MSSSAPEQPQGLAELLEALLQADEEAAAALLARASDEELLQVLLQPPQP